MKMVDEVNGIESMQTLDGLPSRNGFSKTPSLVSISQELSSDRTVEIIGGTLPTSENRLGSHCSSSSGEKNRILTLNNSALSSHEQIFVQGAFLHPTVDYTITHKDTNSTITFLNPIWDAQLIHVRYYIPAT